MDGQNVSRFEQAVLNLTDELIRVLMGVPRTVKGGATEIRLRVGRPMSLTAAGRCWFVDKESQLHNRPGCCLAVTPEDLASTVVRMCAYSLHSHQNELAQGFISLRGGHRAGVCGTAVRQGDMVTAVRDVTSINLRIAREIHGAATPLVEEIFRYGLSGVLIAGAPATGKTTILRDLARQLSEGRAGTPVKVAVVDERGELGAVFEGVPQNDLGPCTDILTGYPKGLGILTAVRTLSPQVVLCDEIGGEAEVDSILDGLHCGVKVVATAHASTMGELLSRRQIKRLVDHGAVDKIVRLGGAGQPGMIEEIIEVGEHSGENSGYVAGGPVLYHDRDLHSPQLVKAGGAD